MIGRKLFVCILFLFCLASNGWAIDIDSGDIPIGEKCDCNFLDVILPTKCNAAFNAGDWSPKKWLYYDAKASDWSPSVMGARVGADGNIAVRFIMTTENVDFLVVCMLV